MRCPFCQNPSKEDSQECPHCGFSLPKLDRYFGTPPPMQAGLSDPQQTLGRLDKARLRSAIEQFRRRFPQCEFTVHVAAVNRETPLTLHAFWIFNRSTLCADLQKGTANRHVLLCIDPANSRACVTLGYGLEPFVGQRHLDFLLQNIGEELHARAWADATLKFLRMLSAQLEEIHRSMKTTYGVELAELGVAAPQQLTTVEERY